MGWRRAKSWGGVQIGFWICEFLVLLEDCLGVSFFLDLISKFCVVVLGWGFGVASRLYALHCVAVARVVKARLPKGI